ncbi:MAG: DNA polymerase III subunit gamma/tau [Planctomycetota bacterium]|nr:DNA polymerase III subunit gamma/tau [Planctomycetota bacterium]
MYLKKSGDSHVYRSQPRPRNCRLAPAWHRSHGQLITTNRVGHAYLFTGTRGVGKTSTARILAKCLNCVEGPTPTPCGVCDICKGIASGDDVDVLEIDGASNNGVDEIRELRSNVNVRPSRARFKIYIIDEVHMLSKSAFNALLKTLEEPPAHVKFIFCTTEADKILPTVVSRCQRFDFPPVATESILERLRSIVKTEGVEAEDAALQRLARRAAGSMRDSQSLLEQLLSFCGRRITEADVHAMLGTARSGRLAAIAEQLIARHAAGVLAQLDGAVAEGVDVGQLAEQLLGFFRDLMVTAVGGEADLMLYTAAGDYPQIKAAGQQFGLETILAAIQILDQAVARMRQSTQVRTLVEMALVRICNLENLEELSKLIAQVRDGGPVTLPAAAPAAASPRPVSPAQKKNESPTASLAAEQASQRPAPVSPAAARIAKETTVGTVQSSPHTPCAESGTQSVPPTIPGTLIDSPIPSARTDVLSTVQAPTGPTPALPASAESVAESAAPTGAPWQDAVATPPPLAALPKPDLTAIERHWQQALEEIGGMTSDFAGDFQSVAISGAISGPNLLVVNLRLAYNKQWCERPEVKRKLEQTLSRLAGRDLRIEFAVVPGGEAVTSAERPQPAQSRMKKMREIEKHPLIRETQDLFDCEVVRVDEKRTTP